MDAAYSSIDILYRYSLAVPTPPSAGQGRVSEDGAGRSEKGFSPDFFQKIPPPSRFTQPLFSKGWYSKKNIFSPFTTIVVSPAIAGGIVACFHGLCEAGTQIKAIKGFVGTPCRVAGKFTRAALHAK